jgi:uncharacterized protein
MNKDQVIIEVEKFAKEIMAVNDGGHDWRHLYRVRKLALYILKEEGKGDQFTVELSALLHDVDDRKFRDSEISKAENIISDFLHKFDIEKIIIDEVIKINKYISFSSGLKPEVVSPEFMIVQDADRLDAIGAVGIARAFNYGGFRNNSIYDPERQSPSTIGHFYDKLLLLKNLMNTNTAKKLASDRHEFLETFLKQFYKEWDFE